MDNLQMMNTEQVLIRLKLDPYSRTVAVQQVREMCEESTNPIGVAEFILKNLTAETEFHLTDASQARHLAQYLVQDAIELGEQYDPVHALDKAAKKVAELRIHDPWLFAKDEVTEHRAGISIEIKADGKLKKGSKQILAAQLFEKHKGLDNKALIEIFQKELDMSVAGARTYAYNCRKAAK
jgi:hypothetical protein